MILERSDSSALRFNLKTCLHCGENVPRVRATNSHEEISEFCCDGCSSVYAFLSDQGLSEEYYGLRAGARVKLKPRVHSDEDYSALDHPPFRKSQNEAATLDFFLEGIHCSACVWLLEKLPSLKPGISAARLDLGRSTLRVRVDEKGSFETVAKLLLSLGYRPHPILNDETTEKRLLLEDRKALKRMGVAAFAAMNVMIYSISLYTGVDGKHAILFRALSLLVSFPAMTYSAWPFYRSAFSALKSGRISIDLPIVIAFIFGYLESARQTYLGTNLIYMDSLTSLVFLMLASRYVLSRLERAELSKSGLLQVLLPARVERKKGIGFESIRTDEIRVGDVILLKSGGKIPADGKIISGFGDVDLSILTGESNPSALKPGDSVYAGSVLAAGEIEIAVTESGTQTRMGQIQSRLDTIGPKMNERTIRSDRWAQIFLGVVIGLSVVLAIAFGRSDIQEAFRRSLSLLIIACPCALALATPLTLARAYRLAAHQGILLRNPEVLDRVLKIRHIVLDKTGTLTKGEPRVESWVWENLYSQTEREFLESVAYTLEAHSRHPYGRAIARTLENLSGVRILENVQVSEIAGQGVSAKIGGDEFRLGRSLDDDAGFSGVLFYRNSKVIARIALRDELRSEVPEVVRELREKKITLQVLSGDSLESTEKVCKRVGIQSFGARLSPEDKKRELEKNPEPTLVIGDGVNDALMVKSADVGVAFNRGDGASIESTLSTSDVAITKPDLRALTDLFDVADRYRSTLTRNAIFSAIYNLIGASVAMAGFIHPLVAAIAMPVSALTVFLSTLHGLRLPKPRNES